MRACIFPQATKTWQKALCATAGAGALGLGVAGTFYGVRYVVRLRPFQRDQAERAATVESVADATPPRRSTVLAWNGFLYVVGPLITGGLMTASL